MKHPSASHSQPYHSCILRSPSLLPTTAERLHLRLPPLPVGLPRKRPPSTFSHAHTTTMPNFVLTHMP